MDGKKIFSSLTKFFLLLSTTQMVFAAEPTFKITLWNTPQEISVPVGTTATAYFNVFNNVPQEFDYIFLKTGDLPKGVQLIEDMSTTCTFNSAFPGGANCIFGLQITGLTDTVGTFTVTPIICESKGLDCSRPDHNNQLKVTVQTSSIIPKVTVGQVDASQPLLLQSVDNGTSWTRITNITNGFPPDGLFNAPICMGTGNTALCFAVGQGSPNAPTPPLMVQSKDGGTTWTSITSSAFPTEGIFTDMSCNGSSSSAFCVVVGANSSTGNTLLLQSSDGGSTWSEPSIGGLPVTGILETVSCDSNSTCVAGGSETGSFPSPSPPIIVVSTDTGTSWTNIISLAIGTLPDYGFIAGVSCSTGACTLGGGDNSSSNTVPLLINFTGSQWNRIPSFTGLPTLGFFLAASCSGSNCVAGGNDNSNSSNVAYLAYSTNAGVDWTTASVSGSPQGSFAAVSCSASTCIAAGGANFLDASLPPVLALTTDITDIINHPWGLVSINNLPSDGTFAGASCANNADSNITCSVSGFEFDRNINEEPLLVTNINVNDVSTSWNIITPNDYPTFGFLGAGDFCNSGGNCGGTSCSGNICIAVGQDSGLSPPLLINSVDDGTTWNRPDLSAVFPATGRFNSTSCGLNSNNTFCIAVGDDLTNGVPLFLSSNNDGVSWSQPSLPSALTGTLKTSACSGSVCIAGGLDTSIHSYLLSTTNSGNTWSIITNNLPSFIEGSSCDGTGLDLICLVVGRTISLSTDGANFTSTSASSAIYFASSCSGSTCVAGGESMSGNPLLQYSTDSGSNWTPLTDITDSGNYSGVSCTGIGADLICVAVGDIFSGNSSFPFLSQGVPSGGTLSWTKPSQPITEGLFLDVSCTGSGSTAICAAVGNSGSFGSGAPTLILSQNGGVDWSIQTGTNFPTIGVFDSVTCSGSGVNTTCIAVGPETAGGVGLLASKGVLPPQGSGIPPYIVVSMNAGAVNPTWTTIQSASGLGLPSSGTLSSVTGSQ